MMRLCLFLISLGCLFAFSDKALGQGQEYTGTAIALPTDDTFYDEETDTWYVVFKFQGSKPWSFSYARFIIKGYSFKGREGFMLKVPNATTHYKIAGSLETLYDEPAWIGLQVECGTPMQYRWNDGSLLSDQTFRAWGPNVGPQARKFCGNSETRVLPVYYEFTDLGMRWIVARESQDIQHIIVVFPPKQADDPGTDQSGAADTGS